MRTLRAGSPLIEITIGQKQLQGRVAAQAKVHFWLLGQDGRMTCVTKDDVKKFHQISPQFKSWPPTIMADQMRRELGASFNAIATRHYVVCAVGEKKAREFGEIFEAFFRSFHAYFSARGFKIDEPEFPLVAIVFPDKESYARYAEAEDMPLTKAMAYYKGSSNRIALFEDAARGAVQQSRLGAPHGLPPLAGRAGSEPFPFGRRSSGAGDALARELFENGDCWGTVPGNLKDTMIHEATHQAAFNTGLHSRIGGNPRWVVEGLATVFEAPGIRNSAANSGVRTRLNHDRFLWFGNYVKDRRKPGSLESFLSGDELFDSDIYDAYSQAWAFSFFLIETRPRPYSEYLRTMAARNHVYVYKPEARLADFKRIVSDELPHLEAEFLRFVAAIK